MTEWHYPPPPIRQPRYWRLAFVWLLAKWLGVGEFTRIDVRNPRTGLVTTFRASPPEPASR